MLNVPSVEKAKFVVWLRSQSVPEKLFAPYVRWMCYYLDFCQKYHFAANRQESLAHFLKKLEDKRQTKEQQQQASLAITLYRSLKFPGGADSDNHPPLPVVAKEQGALTSTAGADPSLPDTAESAIPMTVVINHSQPAPLPTDLHVKNPPTFRPAVTEQGINLPITPKHIQGDLRAGRSPESATLTGASWQAEFRALVDEIRLRHYSPKTLKTYKLWMMKFQAFTRSKPPGALTTGDVKEFLTWLAVKREVSASTQNQAFNALLFLFRHVLHKEFGKVDGVVRAKRKPYIPVVLSRDEVTEVVKHLAPPFDLVVKLLCGCGLPSACTCGSSALISMPGSSLCMTAKARRTEQCRYPPSWSRNSATISVP